MSQATGGGMAAVVGLEEAAVKKILVENDLSSIDIANYNTPSVLCYLAYKAILPVLKLFLRKMARLCMCP